MRFWGLSTFAPLLLGSYVAAGDNCTGYSAHNVREHPRGFSAELRLIGEGCGLYDADISSLRLEVDYDTGAPVRPLAHRPDLLGLPLTTLRTDERLHVKILDHQRQRYQVPEFTVPRPQPAADTTPASSVLRFEMDRDPFSFAVVRKSTGERLFDTRGRPLVFENQYLRLATRMGPDPNVYGLGEHSETFRLPTRGLVRTMWNRDAYGIPQGENLYSSHPVYFEHRENGTHGVFLLNSNGMDVMMDADADGGTTLSYHIIGGLLWRQLTRST